MGNGYSPSALLINFPMIRLAYCTAAITDLLVRPTVSRVEQVIGHLKGDEQLRIPAHYRLLRGDSLSSGRCLTKSPPKLTGF
jgi:hypothetical protein